MPAVLVENGEVAAQARIIDGAEDDTYLLVEIGEWEAEMLARDETAAAAEAAQFGPDPILKTSAELCFSADDMALWAAARSPRFAAARRRLDHRSSEKQPPKGQRPARTISMDETARSFVVGHSGLTAEQAEHDLAWHSRNFKGNNLKPSVSTFTRIADES